MNDYIKTLADHPRISFTGMLYYGNLNTEYIKLNEEYEKNYAPKKETNDINDINETPNIRRSKRLQARQSK